MNDQEQERDEAELRRIPPARLPVDFMARLQAARPGTEPARRNQLQPAAGTSVWRVVLRWLAPAMAVAVAGLLVARAYFNPGSNVEKKPLAAAYGLKADGVEVEPGTEVSSFRGGGQVAGRTAGAVSLPKMEGPIGCDGQKPRRRNRAEQPAS